MRPLMVFMVGAFALMAFPVTSQESLNPGQPEGAYRVMPVFPDEQVNQPAQSQNRPEDGPPRAIVIYPDGAVSQDGRAVPDETASPEGNANAGADPETQAALAAEQQIVKPELLPGHNGMDGVPMDPMQPIRVSVQSPTERQIVESQEVDVFIDLENYQLGTPDSGGNRLHYILDNHPPKVIYDAISPITFKNLSQGGHSIRVYAVRPDGRMFRNSEAFAIRHFYVVRKDFQYYTDPAKPYLTVNLPSGDQVATDEEGRIIFDYKLHNISPGRGYELRYKIGAYEGYLTEDGPVYWSNLATGKHQLEVELLKNNRQPVIGPFNRVEREFSVEKVMRAEPVIPGEETPE